MKRNWGIDLLFISILLTTLGSLAKVPGWSNISNILIVAGCVAFTLAIIKLLIDAFRPKRRTN